MKLDDLARMVALYAGLMGLPMPQIEAAYAITAPDQTSRCAQVALRQISGQLRGAVVLYIEAGQKQGETGPTCRGYTAEQVAVHELCHVRLAHLEIEGLDLHGGEMRRCIAAYRARRRDVR